MHRLQRRDATSDDFTETGVLRCKHKVLLWILLQLLERIVRCLVMHSFVESLVLPLVWTLEPSCFCLYGGAEFLFLGAAEEIERNRHAGLFTHGNIVAPVRILQMVLRKFGRLPAMLPQPLEALLMLLHRNEFTLPLVVQITFETVEEIVVLRLQKNVLLRLRQRIKFDNHFILRQIFHRPDRRQTRRICYI